MVINKRPALCVPYQNLHKQKGLAIVHVYHRTDVYIDCTYTTPYLEFLKTVHSTMQVYYMYRYISSAYCCYGDK